MSALDEGVAGTLEGRSRTARIMPSGKTGFRTLMFGSSISMFGSRISTVAFPMLVLHLNNSPLITGLVAFATIAPSMLFYIPAGVLVDRWNPRGVMLGSEFLRGIAIASVIVSVKFYGAKTSILLIIAAMVSEEILEIFSTLADRRYLTRLVERDKIASSQAYIEVRVHAAVLAGRPIGPWLFSIKPLLPFAADAMSFFLSVVSLLVLPRGKEVVRKPERMSFGQLRDEVNQGFKWLWGNRRAKVTITFMAVTSLIAQALIMMFLAEAHAKQLSTMGIGVVLAASGAGGALGSVMVRMIPAEVKRRWSVIKNRWLEFQLSAWSIAIGLLAMTGGLSVWCSAGAMFMLGFTGAIGNIAFGTYLVSNVADNMLARVTSIGQVLAIGACALGPVIGGVAIQLCGPKGAVWVLFSAVAAATLFVLELDHGIAQKIWNAVRSAFARKIRTARGVLCQGGVTLARVRFSRLLIASPERKIGQRARIIYALLSRLPLSLKWSTILDAKIRWADLRK